MKYITFEEIVKAYLDCRKNKRNTKQQLEFELNLWDNLYDIYIHLNKLDYTFDKSIAFVVSRPVYREVFAALFRDRIIHHILYNRINDVFEKYVFIDDCYACRVGKGTLYGIRRCYNKIKECSSNYNEDCYVLKCDLKSFFMSIDKTLLYGNIKSILCKFGDFSENDMYFNDYLLKLIIFNCPQNNCIIRGSKKMWSKLPKDKSLFYTDNNHGIPIGNLMSQILANVYLSKLDNYIINELGFKYYGRYVDDFFIIDKNKDKMLSSIPMIRNFLLKILKIRLHPKKIYLQNYKKGLNFIGAVLKPNRVYISNRTKGNFYNALKNLNDNFEYSDKFLISALCTINSYLGIMVKFNTYKIRRRLLISKSFKNLNKLFYHKNRYKKVALKKWVA